MSVKDESADYSPLSQACVKALTDKMEEKRKFAATEIEKMTVEFSMSNNLTMINRLIIVLGRKFCLAPNSNTRKGGLLGLAAVMVGFKNGSLNEPPAEVVEEVVRPILTCLLDSDSRVRYYACESLYNVTKVAKANFMPQFEAVFDKLSKIVADPDIGVRSGAEMLDRLLKDIIVEQSPPDVKNHVPKLEEYIYSRNLFTRMFIISWIRLLDTRIDMTDHLPRLLDGIFKCLYDANEEIKASTLSLLSEFINKIVMRPTDEVDLPALTTTLLKHAKTDKEDVVQYTALAWLRQFIGLMDNPKLMNFTPGILVAILPCLAVQSTPEGSMVSNPPVQRFMPQSTSRNNICEIALLLNSSLQELVTMILVDRRNAQGSDSNLSDIEPILEVLVKELQRQDHPVIKLAVLDWLQKLKRAEPDLNFTQVLQQKLFQILLETLSARSDAVVKRALRVIADFFCFDGASEQQVIPSTAEKDVAAAKAEDHKEPDKRKSPLRAQASQRKDPNSTAKKVAIASGDGPSIQQSNANISRFIQALCKTFREKDIVLEDRGTFIIMDLCSFVKPEIIYRSFAEILKDEKADLKFAQNMVQKLNQILLTTQPLSGLRSRLGNDDDPEVNTIFQSLYYAWCHSPIAALTLCLLTNNYRHASEIVVSLSKTDINLDLLTQLDWIVQLIESPVFASLRMKLLDINNNQYLLQTLYGLLMILPQSEAHKRLGLRLDQAYKFMTSQSQLKSVAPSSAPSTQTRPWLSSSN